MDLGRCFTDPVFETKSIYRLFGDAFQVPVKNRLQFSVFYFCIIQFHSVCFK